MLIFMREGAVFRSLALRFSSICLRRLMRCRLSVRRFEAGSSKTMKSAAEIFDAPLSGRKNCELPAVEATMFMFTPFLFPLMVAEPDA